MNKYTFGRIPIIKLKNALRSMGLTDLVNKLRWGGDPDTPNPVSGMTPRQIRAVKTTWARVYSNALPNGTELFKRLFRNDPEAKQFFKTFRNMSEQELVTCPQFKAHVMTFMNAVNMAVNNLKRPDVVGAMLVKLGENHNKRGVQPKHFQSATDTLRGMLKNDFHLNDYEMNAWSAFIVLMQNNILPQLK